MNCRICHTHANSSESDNSQLFTADFTACELLFLFFCSFGNILCNILFFQPLNASDNISGCQQHSRNHHFLYSVGICSRCIKYYNSLFCHFFQRNVVYTGSCSCHCRCFFCHFQIVHICTSHQYGIRFLHTLCIFIFCRKLIKTNC